MVEPTEKKITLMLTPTADVRETTSASCAQLAGIKRGGVISLQVDLKIGEAEYDRHATDHALSQPEE
jgi:hypothetical protein